MISEEPALNQIVAHDLRAEPESASLNHFVLSLIVYAELTSPRGVDHICSMQLSRLRYLPGKP